MIVLRFVKNDLYVRNIERGMGVLETGHASVDSQAYRQGHVLWNRGIMSVLHMMLFEFILKIFCMGISIYQLFLGYKAPQHIDQIIIQYPFHWTRYMLQLTKFYS